MLAIAIASTADAMGQRLELRLRCGDGVGLTPPLLGAASAWSGAGPAFVALRCWAMLCSINQRLRRHRGTQRNVANVRSRLKMA